MSQKKLKISLINRIKSLETFSRGCHFKLDSRSRKMYSSIYFATKVRSFQKFHSNGWQDNREVRTK